MPQILPRAIVIKQPAHWVVSFWKVAALLRLADLVEHYRRGQHVAVAPLPTPMPGPLRLRNG